MFTTNTETKLQRLQGRRSRRRGAEVKTMLIETEKYINKNFVVLIEMWNYRKYDFYRGSRDRSRKKIVWQVLIGSEKKISCNYFDPGGGAICRKKPRNQMVD